jgi:hypothetical protein
MPGGQYGQYNQQYGEAEEEYDINQLPDEEDDQYEI